MIRKGKSMTKKETPSDQAEALRKRAENIVREKTILNRIFDPFSTTKDPGKGTGLGLSICRSIILEHGGAIRAENNDMGGASFIVELPM
jgi:nitrogen fixation/metabolism regulation signal transduction histidine kinase